MRFLTVLTSSKLSSYCPASSLTITRLLRPFCCFLEIFLALGNSLHLRPGPVKEQYIWVLTIEFLCEIKAPLPLQFKPSTHKNGEVWESTTDEPTTNKDPTILTGENFHQNRNIPRSRSNFWARNFEKQEIPT